MTDDATLIAESLERPERFGELFDRHFAALFGFCARRVGPSHAEDVAGEAFRRAFEARAQFHAERGDALPWLIGIALNVVRHEARRKEREARAFRRSATLGRGHDGGFEADLVEHDHSRAMIRQIEDSLSRLPAGERDALLLFAWEARSYSEIAEITDVSVGTVRSRIYRARQRLGSLAVSGVPTATARFTWR